MADTITMTEIVGESFGLHDVINFSPDRTRFAVVTQRGDLNTGERVFSLLIFDVAKMPNDTPVVAAIMRTSQNEDGIDDARWLNDDTLTFLGVDRHDETRQVYTVDVRTRKVTQLSRSLTKVNAYAVSPDRKRILYTADADLSSEHHQLQQHGFTVTDQSFTDVMMGNYDARRLMARDLGYEVPQDTFVQDVTSNGLIAVKRGGGEKAFLPSALFPYSRNPISPDGRFAIILGFVRSRANWEKFYKPTSTVDETFGYSTAFLLLNLATGKTSPLVDAPASPYLDSVIWSPDSKSVVLVNTFQPLDTDDRAAATFSSSQTVVAEVNIASRKFTRIRGPALYAAAGDGLVCAQLMRWDAHDNSLVFALREAPDNSGSGSCDADRAATYEKIGTEWHEVSVQPAESAFRQGADHHWAIAVDEGLNTPPNLKVTDLTSGRSSIFTDFNPEFRRLTLAPVSLVSWTASDGTVWSGDLYIPPGHRLNARDPLVIQTHGCTTDKFLVNGFPSGTAYAAQVLASSGIMVLQEGGCTSTDGPMSANAPKATYSNKYGSFSELGFDAAIDYLDKKGLIDRNRVGLQGHSATSWQVLYAAAHPKPNYGYRAIISTARDDLGYFAYLATQYGHLWSDQENAGAPFGAMFKRFAQNALPFHLDRVDAPILSQEPDGIRYLPLMWEAHEVLKGLNKPEELVVFPGGVHNLVQPWQRLTSQQIAVDWFRFWLQGYEDSSPEKVEQYRRWEKLCDVQNAETSGHPTYCVPTSEHRYGAH